MSVHLIQSADLFGPPERQAELQRVWKINEGLFDRITSPQGHPTFRELFLMCLPGVVNVIANADIHFDPMGLALVTKYFSALQHQKTVMALSRWDVRPDGKAYLWDHLDSQDAWILYGAPHEIEADFPMGVAGCDNRLLHNLRAAGYGVVNPSRTIKAYHLHNVEWRSYLVDNKGKARGGNKIERIPPPYAFEKPHEL